jgi:hypothetical protein
MFCWLFRLMISHAADGDNPLSPAAEKHIRHCEDCRYFYSTCLLLSERLKSEIVSPDRNLSVRLRKRVLTAMPHQQTKTISFRIKWWPAAVAACLTLIVLIGAMFFVKRLNDRLTAIRDVRTDIRNLQTIVGKEFPAAWPELIEGPLANEAKNLADDTEAAVRFLVACVTVDVTGPENESIN